jgi:hypothetical protein
MNLEAVMSRVLQTLSVLVLALFAAVWIWIGFRLIFFHPARDGAVLDLTDAQVTVAGFLASAIGAGTASVLGIEIQKVQQQTETAAGRMSIGAQVNQAVGSSILLMIGIATYAAVGVFVLVVWFLNSAKSTDVIGAFSFGVLGWLAGAFAAVFRK